MVTQDNMNELLNDYLKRAKNPKDFILFGVDSKENVYPYDSNNKYDLVDQLVKNGKLAQWSIDYSDIDNTLRYNTNFDFVAMNF